MSTVRTTPQCCSWPPLEVGLALRWAVALALACAGSLAACGAQGSGTLSLSWRFADNRRCADAGVASITVSDGETVLGGFACADGAAPATVMIENVPRSATLTARAMSAQSGELYRGQLILDPALLPATVTLHPTFAR